MLANLGAIPLENITAHNSFNTKNIFGYDNAFYQNVNAKEGATYVVLINKAEFRGLMAFNVESITQPNNSAMKISYAVLEYETMNVVEQSPGFSWTKHIGEE